MMRTIIFSFFFICQSFALTIQTSIKPIASLVLKVTDGTSHEVSSLYDGNLSPHSSSLTMKDVTVLKNADLFIWVGEAYESAMAKHFKKLSPEKSIVLMEYEKIKKLSPRFGHHHTHDHDEHDDHCCDYDEDGHVWMNIENAKAILDIVCEKLSVLDPANKGRFEENLLKAKSELDAFHQKWREVLHHSKNYMTFHDFSNYLDDSFGTKCAGVLSLDASHGGLSAKHIAELQKVIRTNNVQLFLYEPQFPNLFIKIAPENAVVHAVDYLGSNKNLTKNLFEEILEDILDLLKA